MAGPEPSGYSSFRCGRTVPGPAGRAWRGGRRGRCRVEALGRMAGSLPSMEDLRKQDGVLRKRNDEVAQTVPG
eukprot:10015493-Heterocapsa_arctica.AAC.1